MNTRSYPSSLLVLSLALLPIPQASAAPNILLITADDLGIEHLSFYGIGTQAVSTPNLAELAARGLVFDQAWSNPVCSPTRATIQTGEYAFRTGIGANTFNHGEGDQGLSPESLILPELLQLHARTPYQTALFGKWHLGVEESSGGTYAPNLAGYDQYEGVLELEDTILGDEIRKDIYFNYQKVENGNPTEVSGGYLTSDIVDWTLNWIENTPEPWLAVVNHFAPHSPFHWPPQELHQQDTADKSDLNKYRAMVQAMDAELGRLLDKIDRKKTLVIFTSDNGSPLETAVPPVRPTRAKTTLFQGGIRVPLIIAGTGVTTGVVHHPVNLTDLFATIAKLGNAEMPAGAGLDSVSLVPYFTNPSRASLRDYVYSEKFSPNGSGPYSRGAKAVRDLQYKLVRTQAGAERMADLLADPWETIDLLAGEMTSDQKAAYQRLSRIIERVSVPGTTD